MDCGYSHKCLVHCQNNCFKNGIINAINTSHMIAIGNTDHCFENAMFILGDRTTSTFQATAYNTFYNAQIYGGNIYSDIMIICGCNSMTFVEESYDKYCQKMTVFASGTMHLNFIMLPFTRLGGDPMVSDDRVIVHCPNNVSFTDYDDLYYNNSMYHNESSDTNEIYNTSSSYLDLDQVPCIIDLAHNSSLGAVDFWIDYGIPDSLNAYYVEPDYSLFFELPSRVKPMPNKIIDAEEVNIFCRYRDTNNDGDDMLLLLNETVYDMNGTCIYDQMEFDFRFPTTTKQEDEDGDDIFDIMRRYYVIEITLIVTVVCMIVLCVWYWTALTRKQREKKAKLKAEIFASNSSINTVDSAGIEEDVVQIDGNNHQNSYVTLCILREICTI